MREPRLQNAHKLGAKHNPWFLTWGLMDVWNECGMYVQVDPIFSKNPSAELFEFQLCWIKASTSFMMIAKIQTQ